MKPEDIVVGKKYTNGVFTYLGVGKRVMWEGGSTNFDSRFTNKTLVLIDEDPDFIGQMVQNPEDCNDTHWSSIHEVE